MMRSVRWGTLSNVLGFEDYEKSPKGGKFPPQKEGNFLPFFVLFFCFLGEIP
jgi:hypothetical protein